jgi:transposase
MSASAHPPRARHRQQYTLAEKLTILRESQQPGVTQAHVTRKYNLGKNVLWSWRKALGGFALGNSDACGQTQDGGLHDLEAKIAELERLLGQKSFEIELLRNRLQERGAGQP